MRKILSWIRKNISTTIKTIVLTIIPAGYFYWRGLQWIFASVPFDLNISDHIFNIITGLLLGGMFLLYTRSRNEYNRIKGENQRIREMLLTIHVFDTMRFIKVQEKAPNIFDKEEQRLKGKLRDQFKRDLDRDYTDAEIQDILDCFYHKKMKFPPST